jgi:hypothetical protein
MTPGAQLQTDSSPRNTQFNKSTRHCISARIQNMKTPIAVTLIIMGALLVMTPALADFLYQRNVVALMARSGVTSVTLAGQMSDLYRFGCWFSGSGMVAVAVLCSVFIRRATHEHTSLVTQGA